MCFQWFLRVGGASGAPKGRLEGPLRGTLGPKVTTWTHIFAIRIQVRFLSATWERQMRSRSVNVKGWSQVLAQRRGGRLRSPNFAEVIYTVIQHALLPLSRGAADLLASPLPPAPCLVAAASLFGRSDNLGIILISFWCHF